MTKSNADESEDTHVSDLTQEQKTALEIAHWLADQGAPIFAAHRNSGTHGGEFFLPWAWQTTKPLRKDVIATSHRWINMWRPGMALAMVCGVVYDVVDVDPRNGGDALSLPLFEHFGIQATPSEGEHFLIARTHLAKGKIDPGVDLQCGDDKGDGRGFVYLAPTERVSKYGARKGELVAYRWGATPTVISEGAEERLGPLVEAMTAGKRPARPAPAPAAVDGDDDPFYDDAVNTWTPEQANRVIDGQIAAVRAAREGAINSALGGAARAIGRFVAGGYIAQSEAEEKLLAALEEGGVHSDRWNVQNGKSWTAATVIGAGMARGMEEPYVVVASATSLEQSHSAHSEGTAAPVTTAGVSRSAGAFSTAQTGGYPSLHVTSAAEMAYWLQSAMGTASLSGFFLRQGQLVHTPRVNELGYVAARDGKDDDNGPAQIAAVTAGTLTAKIQYAHRCYKMEQRKDENGKKTGEQFEVPALFPLQAAQRAVDAPEALAGLRVLRGITHTPMVRSDGSVLATPGYDRASGFLFLPGQGVGVSPVPDVPTAGEVNTAMRWLEEMTAGFPWGSADDRANYYGLLLTPLLRLLAPPSYKMFGITAHQPGSGKTLLADVARIIHGGVLRTEWPEEEKEVKSMSAAILTGTAAPIVHVDNITGVLKSSALAGLITADGVIQEREYGANTRMLSYVNDRVWTFTGNNMSLGGDLVRRTVLIQIDPNMANPEERSFAIANLKAWAAEHRNELLWSLLVLVRHWVATGSVPQERKQSDSFAHWEATVGGILAAANVPGSFDAGSGKKAAVGGDDEATAAVLEMLWEKFQGERWQAAKAIEARSEDWNGLAIESLEWLPSSVLEKLTRSPAAGRKTFGYWLRNRLGRWVTGSDGHAYVIREDGKDRMGAYWKVERSA